MTDDTIEEMINELKSNSRNHPEWTRELEEHLSSNEVTFGGFMDSSWIRAAHQKDKTVTLLLFSCSVMSDSLWLYGLQHTSLPCPSPSPGACSNSCPLSQWCHPNISSSVIPFSFCLQSFPASGSFLMNRLFTSSGQSIAASASATVLLINI